jgi:hypothetical protein
MDNVLNSLKTIGMDAMKTTVSTVAVHMTVGPVIVNFAGENEILQYSAEGSCNALASDIVDYFVKGQSKLLSGDIVALLDDAVFMGVLSGGCDKSGVSQILINTVGYAQLPIDNKYQLMIVQGGIIAGAREASNYLARSQLGQNQLVQYVRHPVSSVMGRR